MKKLAMFVGVLLVCFTFCSSLFAATVNFSWNANTDDTVGYKLYQATTSSNFTKGIGIVANVSGITTTTYSLTISTDGTYYWRLTAYDAAGNESDFSDSVTTTIDSKIPTTPTNLKITGVSK